MDRGMNDRLTHKGRAKYFSSLFDLYSTDIKISAILIISAKTDIPAKSIFSVLIFALRDAIL